MSMLFLNFYLLRSSHWEERVCGERLLLRERVSVGKASVGRRGPQCTAIDGKI